MALRLPAGLRLAGLAAVLLGVIGAAPAGSPPQAAQITGRVVTSQGRPLRGANVYVTELGLSVGSDGEGRYRLTVPARALGRVAVVRARSIGFRAAEQRITIEPGTLRADFRLVADVERLGDAAPDVVSSAAPGSPAGPAGAVPARPAGTSPAPR